MSRTFSVRPYIGSDRLKIDGRTIPYPLVNSRDYLMAKKPEMTDEEYGEWQDANYEQDKMLNTIIAMKQSCFLLRYTSYSCGSLSDDLYQHKNEMVVAYNEKYPEEPFDEKFYEEYRNKMSVQYEHVYDINFSDMKAPMGVVFYNPMDFQGKFVVRLMDMIDGGVAVSNAIVVKDTLEECRQELILSGFMNRIPRSYQDDPCIVETWMN